MCVCERESEILTLTLVGAAQGFRHQPTEVWENPAESMNFKVCNATNGEDPKCSDSVIRDSVYDHLHYYGIAEGCSGSW